MAFNTADRVAIADILGLDRTQYSDKSRLSALLEEVVTFDALENTDIETQVKPLISDIQTLDATIEALEDSGSGLELTVAIPNEITIQRQNGIYQYTGVLNRRRSKEQRLRDLIDPDKTLDQVTPGGNILF
jgi:hypothetical protein